MFWQIPVKWVKQQTLSVFTKPQIGKLKKNCFQFCNNMKCDDCGLDISGTYFETGGKTICKKDYEEVYVLIIFFHATFNLFFFFFFFNQKYRKVCSVCDNAISGTFYEKDGKFTCAECYKVRPKKSFSKKKTQIFYWKCLLEN